jgi:outer membrane protein assembly factor BamA
VVQIACPKPAFLAALALGLALGLGCAPGAEARIFPSVNARAPQPEAPRPQGLPTDAKLEALGARIGAIHFDSRDLFDVDGHDENTALSRLGNRLHIQTRIATLEDQLLFRSGDPYRASLLAESARILRETRYLHDAQVRPLAFHDGLVDVEVTTQDVWTFNPGMSFGRKGGENTSGFELEELNFLGTGTQLGVGFKSGIDRESRYLQFADRQLGSTWWSLSTVYSDNSDGRLGELTLEKPFYSLGSHRAGGVSLLDDQRVDARYDAGEIIDRFATHERRSTIYLGRSPGLVEGWARRLTAGVTFDEHVFDQAPGFDAPLLLPADRKLVYPWIGAEWVEDAFATGRNRDQIEKTEDYSLGWRARAQLGFASAGFGSDRDAIMLSGGVAKGLSLSERQSMFIAADAGGRLESGAVAGATLQGDARYYFRQSPHRLLFLNLSAVAGANLDQDQQILLGGDSGLRGYPLRYQAGEGRWLFTAEQRFFTNWYPLQLFNVGGAVFYDMGATWGQDLLGTPSQGLLRDIGFGLRLGSSRSARGNVLHFDIAFPLDGDSSVRSVQYLIETKASF